MALPPSDTSNDAFVREVDEEFRRDQLLGLWQKYGRLGMGLLAALLLLVAGYLYYTKSVGDRAGAQGEAYDAAVKSGSDADLAKIAASGNPGFRASARFAQGDLALSKKDFKGAAAHYAAVANDSSVPQPFRDRALIQQTSAEFDLIDPQVVIDRLKGLAVPDSPWFGTAGELVAIAYLKQGKRTEAGKLFDQIGRASGPVPDSIRQRALQMAGNLGVYANDQAGKGK